MAWFITVGSTLLNRPIPDQAIESIREQLKRASVKGTSVNIRIGELTESGTQIIHWTPGVPVIIHPSRNAVRGSRGDRRQAPRQVRRSAQPVTVSTGR